MTTEQVTSKDTSFKDVSLAVTPEVLINGDKLFHMQSYDIGGGQRRYDGIWMPGNDGRPVIYGWTLFLTCMASARWAIRLRHWPLPT